MRLSLDIHSHNITKLIKYQVLSTNQHENS
jgi:hypothetical protein